MTLSINCCLKPSSSPNPSSSTRSTPTPQCLISKDQNEWRGRFIATMACVVISSSAGAIVHRDFATAGELVRPAETSSAKLIRWSDKRTCPPWVENSLESIVPENLPRPFSSRRPNNIVRRGNETVDVGGGVLIRFDKRCFSL